MPVGQSERVALRYLKESTWGTTPGSALTELRYTTESLTSEKETAPSADIIQERRVREILELGKSGSGDMEFELSYGNLDDFLEGALMSTWSIDDPTSGVDTLTDGTTLTSFTLEKEYTNLTTPEFYTFTGSRIGGASFNFEPGSPITASMSMMSKGGTVSESSAGTGAATSASANDVMVVGAHVSSFKEGGTTTSDELTDILGFTLEIENNLRLQRNITSLDPYNIGAGRLSVTGTLQAYLSDSSLIDKFEDFTTSELQVIVADGSSNQYQFDLFSLNFTGGTIPHPGTEGDMIVDLTWEAFKDSSEGTVISIERS